MVKKHFKTITIGLAFVMAISLSGCGTSGSSSISGDSNTQTAQENTNSGISSEDVCNGVGAAYQTYQKEFSDFRYGPSTTPWQVFYDLSDKASGALQDVAGQIDSYGIDWDSAAIVSSMIYSAADTIDSIKEYTSQNYFPPGSDLQTLLDQIDVSVNSVLNSSCTGHD